MTDSDSVGRWFESSRAHHADALLESRAFFLYVENHSLGEWFQRRLVPMMKTEKLLLL